MTLRFKEIVRSYTGAEFPSDPYEQLKLATAAVFASWNGKRARDYRNASRIPHDLGTAVNIQAMVFGNMGPDSGTGDIPVALGQFQAVVGDCTADARFRFEWK